MKNVEIRKWLERLPLEPEFYPTDTEFADPIAYISKIEKEASAFGAVVAAGVVEGGDGLRRRAALAS